MLFGDDWIGFVCRCLDCGLLFVFAVLWCVWLCWLFCLVSGCCGLMFA